MKDGEKEGRREFGGGGKIVDESPGKKKGK